MYFQGPNHTEYSLTMTKLKLEVNINKIARDPQTPGIKHTSK